MMVNECVVDSLNAVWVMRFTSRVLALRRAEGARRTRTVSIDWNGVTFGGLLW